jgi:lambda family phage portal protein
MALTLLNLETEPFSVILAEKNKRAKVQRSRKMRRSFEGAKHSRLTNDWLTSTAGINYELRQNLRTLRHRSRDLARNSDYVKKFLGMCRANIVGTNGIQAQIRFPEQPAKSQIKIAKAVQEAWQLWSTKEFCTMSGKMSLVEGMRLFVQHLARDGECLIRFIYDNSNPFGFSLKFYDARWLDETYTESLTNGNRVLLGVEVDNFDKPVAYWLTPPTVDFLPTERRNRSRFRVPASEILHSFLIVEEEEQARGIPWLHTAIMRLKMLDGYEEAELVAARIEASKMGFYIPPVDEDENLTEDDDAPVEFYESAEPGMFARLPPGYDFKTFDPKHPTGNGTDFVKRILRGVAAGLDVTYHALASDLEAVNYSSARIGLLEERDMWRVLQQFTIENFCRPIFKAWLEAAFLRGAVNLSFENYQKLQNPVWRGRGWAWVDPQKDINASVTALENGLTTRTDILAEQGADFEQILETLKHEEDLIKKYGLIFNADKEKNPPKASEKTEIVE